MRTPGFFYQFDRQLLQQHASNEMQKHPAMGIGGQGEVAVLERLVHVGRYIPIYHGITTLLRLGDITLIDMERWRVAAIGEIKTTPPTNGVANSIVTFIGHRADFSVQEFTRRFMRLNGRRRSRAAPQSNVDSIAPSSLNAKASAEAQARFERQITRTRESLDASHRSMLGESEIPVEFTPLTRLEQAARSTRPGKFKFCEVDEGLIVLAYRSRARSLFRRIAFTEGVKSADLPEEGVTLIQGTVIGGAAWNRVLFGQLQYNDQGFPKLFPGALPLPWWRIDPIVARDIVFHRLAVITVWNPAKTVALLEEAGFKVQPDLFPQPLTLSFQIDERRWTYVDPTFAGYIPLTLTRAVDWIKSLTQLREHARQSDSHGERSDVRTIHQYFSQAAVNAFRGKEARAKARRK